MMALNNTHTHTILIHKKLTVSSINLINACQIKYTKKLETYEEKRLCSTDKTRQPTSKICYHMKGMLKLYKECQT